MGIMDRLWIGVKPLAVALALVFSVACSSGKVERKVTMKPVLSPEAVNSHLAKFREPARQRLETVLFKERFDGAIDSKAVKDVLGLQGDAMTFEQFMLDMLPIAQLYSQPATSAYRVGAVCSGAKGDIYFGANLELANAPLGFTIHAEQSAIADALAHGETAIQRLAVTAAPCGHCRQFLNELTTASSLQVIIAGKPPTTLAALLPDSFGPVDLGVQGGLSGQTETQIILPPGTVNPIAEAALQAASRSYSPYTQSHSGVAFRLKDGTIVAGSYIENAAYNPSLPPVIAAIDRLRFSGRQYSDISEAQLVELEGAKISQEGMTRLVLHGIAPGVELRTLKARLAKASATLQE
jgi:cytidine deaminase